MTKTVLGFGAIVIAIMLVMMPTAANGAERVAQYKDMEITLFDTPCVSTAEEFANIPNDVRALLKAGSVLYEGTLYDLCWAEIEGDDRYFVVDQKGGRGRIDKGLFKYRNNL